jgi:membrane associated rhomboid family serine protease
MIPLKDNIPNERFPFITVVLVVINVVAYLYSIRHGGSLFGGPSKATVEQNAAIPFDFTHPGKYCMREAAGFEIECKQGPFPGQISTVAAAFAAMFLHGNILHIAGNMIFLAIFGPNVEDSMGRLRFVAFYIVGGLTALAAQIVVEPNSTVPTLGASGAIAAVMGGYIVLYPRARILSLVFVFFFVTIIEVPALLMLGFWFLEQVYFGAAGLQNPAGGAGGVASFAHVGGFVFGLVLIRVLATRIKPTPPRYPVY